MAASLSPYDCGKRDGLLQAREIAENISKLSFRDVEAGGKEGEVIAKAARVGAQVVTQAIQAALDDPK